MPFTDPAFINVLDDASPEASQGALLSVGDTSGCAPRSRRPILVMGYAALALLLLLCGCSPSPSPSDAAPAQDIVAPSLDIALDDASLSDEPSLLDASTEDRSRSLDRPATADRYDAAADAPPDRWVTVGDASLPIRTFESFGPARQMRHNCPGVLDGEAGIPAPRLIYPLSGLRATSRRPGFRWELAPGTIGARIEVCADPCCARVITAYDANGTSQPPAEMLPPGVVWWRARGRTAEAYGRATSFTWELGIRHRSAPIDTAWDHIRDINGDGYDDIVTTADPVVNGRTRVYTIFGSASGPVFDVNTYRPLLSIDDPISVTGCDFNADGHMDLVTNSSGYDGGVTSTLSLLWGGVAGMDFQAPLVLEDYFFGWNASDINGDGFEDVVVKRIDRVADSVRTDLGVVVLHGGPGRSMGGVSIIPRRTFVETAVRPNHNVWSVGDLNGDGYADVIVGDFTYRPRGRMLIFPGGPNGPSTVASRVIEYDQEFARSLGSVVYPAGDLDGDQLADFIVPMWIRGEVLVYRGNREVFAELAVVLRPPYIPKDTRIPSDFGNADFMGCGPDQNGDGRADLVVPCPRCFAEDQGDFRTGILYLYDWNPVDGLLGVTAVRQPDADNWFGLFASSSSGVGDIDGDGFDELSVGRMPHDAVPADVLDVFRGGPGGFNVDRRWQLAGPQGRPAGSFGTFLASYRLRSRLEWNDG